VQDQQALARARYNSMSTPFVPAELDESGMPVQQFDDGPDLSARQILCRAIRQQGDDIQRFQVGSHQSTQQVTKRGAVSPVRSSQIVLTTA